MPIITTAGETFTDLESVDMARLVSKRFGNLTAATAAWNRLLESHYTEQEFSDLICDSTHTPHCQGDCQNHSSRDNGH